MKNTLSVRVKIRALRGVVTIEAAFVFPVLLIVLMGVADVGRMGYTSMAVSNACRIAADYAAANRDSELFLPQWNEQIKKVMFQELEQIPGYSAEQVTFLLQSEGALETGRKHVITVTYDYETLLRWPGSGGVVVIQDKRTVVNYQ